MRQIKNISMFLACVFFSACTGSSFLDDASKASTKVVNLETAEITLETAGTLGDKLGDKAATTQKLVLNGPADAGDIDVIIKMPQLVSLDIKGVELVESDKQYTAYRDGKHSIKKNTIGEYMFFALKLTELVLPENIEKIEQYGLAYLPIETIDLPATLTELGYCAFEKCTKLQSVIIPEKMKSIGDGAFNSCTALHSVTLPKNLVKIESRAFEHCTSLQTIDIPQTVTEIEEYAFAYSGLKSVTLPEDVKTVGAYCFSGCTALEEVNLPDGFTTIAYCMFERCTSLVSIKLPETVVSIGVSSFSNCTSLQSINVPESVTKIAVYAFEVCTSLQSITLPNSVTCIEKEVFRESGLTSITIPAGITEIAERTFSSCKSLAEVHLPSGLTTISWAAFSGCISLQSIELPETLSGIGDDAFKGCGLTSITIPKNVSVVAGFSDCKSLTKVILPESVTKISDGAFSSCSSLKEIILPSNLLNIESGAFEYCTSLKSIDIPKSVQVIKFSSFRGSHIGGIFVNGKTQVGDIFYHYYEHDNGIIYLSDPSANIDAGLKNVVINGVATSLVIDSEGSFYCPREFKAQKIIFTSHFGTSTIPGKAAGWTAISLPFDVKTITHSDGRVLAPFNAEVADAKPFWLRRLTDNGFENATSIEAGVPYIIGMPNNEKYEAEYRITGDVTFGAADPNGIIVPVTPAYQKTEGPLFDFTPSYEAQPKSASVYVLNTYNDVSGYYRGGVFARSLRDTKPFEPYVTNKAVSSRAPAVYSIGGTARTKSIRAIGGKPSIDDM